MKFNDDINLRIIAIGAILLIAVGVGLITASYVIESDEIGASRRATR